MRGGNPRTLFKYDNQTKGETKIYMAYYKHTSDYNPDAMNYMLKNKDNLHLNMEWDYGKIDMHDKLMVYTLNVSTDQHPNIYPFKIECIKVYADWIEHRECILCKVKALNSRGSFHYIVGKLVKPECGKTGDEFKAEWKRDIEQLAEKYFKSWYSDDITSKRCQTWTSLIRNYNVRPQKLIIQIN